MAWLARKQTLMKARASLSPVIEDRIIGRSEVPDLQEALQGPRSTISTKQQQQSQERHSH